jgi:hypothetical protein
MGIFPVAPTFPYPLVTEPEFYHYNRALFIKMSAQGIRLYFIQTKSLHKYLADAVYSSLQHLFTHWMLE